MYIYWELYFFQPFSLFSWFWLSFFSMSTIIPLVYSLVSSFLNPIYYTLSNSWSNYYKLNNILLQNITKNLGVFAYRSLESTIFWYQFLKTSYFDINYPKYLSYSGLVPWANSVKNVKIWHLSSCYTPRVEMRREGMIVFFLFFSFSLLFLYFFS